MRSCGIAGLALGTSVTCSAPASRPLVPSSNKSIQVSPPPRIQLPIVLDFHSKEGKRNIAKWYRQQPTTHFNKVEYRKQAGGLFRHEFVVVHLSDLTLCRFDRRAREDLRGHALKDEGTISEDSAHVIAPEDAHHKAYLHHSEVLLRIDLPQELDLKFILAVCYGIQFHPKAKSYSLLYYNCYFFSWTLITAIARRASRWEETIRSRSLRKEIAEIIALEYSQAIGLKLNESIARPRPNSRKGSRSFIRKIWGVVSHNSVEPGGAHGNSYSENPGVPEEQARKTIPNQGSLRTRTQRELESVPDLISDSLGTLLLKSQLSKLCPTIRGGIDSVSWKASGIVAGQCAVDAVLEYYAYDMFDMDSGSGDRYSRDFIEKVTTSTASRANQKIINSLRARGANRNKEPDNWYKFAMDLGEDEWENSWDNVWAEEIGAQYRKGIIIYFSLDASPSVGKKVWRKVWEIFQDGRIREVIAMKIGGKLSEYLVDPPFEIAQSASEAHEDTECINPQLHRENSVTSNIQGSGSRSQTLQDYIRVRMVAHFEQVESYGFGRAGELIDKAEDSMCDIWETAVRMMRIVA